MELKPKYHNKDLNIAYNDGIKAYKERVEKVIDEVRKKGCYCKRQEGTMFSKTKESKRYCAYCWIAKELKQKLEEAKWS